MGSYSRLNQEDTTVSTDKVVTNAWSGDTDILLTAFTSSTQAVFTTATSQGNFFLEIYKDDVNLTSSAPVQATVSYGHKAGSGSLNFTNTAGALGNTATKCIYNQYKQLIFGDENSNFTFNGYESNDIWVLNIARGRYKHSLKAGSLNLVLTDGNAVTHLTDDSVTLTGSSTITNLGRQFNLVSGSDGTMLGSNLNQTTAGSGSFGFVYPEAGVIILNGEALRNVSPSKWLEGTVATSNQERSTHLYTALKAGSFQVDSEEKVSSQFMFVRVKNSEYNYSSNPSYIDGNGNLNNTTMADSPTTYITTVGLYNDDNNLLAVAKLSQPLKKDFTTEALVRIKLDY
tara:strand:- start:1221 stop:2249 length:1029 start_codon:yes stop_codon:yes gene_type:complete